MATVKSSSSRGKSSVAAKSFARRVASQKSAGSALGSRLGIKPATSSKSTSTSLTGSSGSSKRTGRTGESLTINQTTNEVVGVSTGKIYGQGKNLQQALALQTQLQSGGTPTVSGRPDLYAIAPTANEKQSSYYDPSTKTTVTPKVATADELASNAAGTLASFNSSQGLTYLNQDTFTNLQPNLTEEDLVRGPNGQIWLKQGLTVEDIQARAQADTGTGSTDVPYSDLNIDVPTEFDSNTYDSAFTVPKTTSDIEALIANNQALQQDYINSLAQSPEEVALQTQLTDVDQQIANYMSSFDAGINKIEDEVIPMSFITGQEASLERRSQADLANLTRYQDVLTKRLGIATSNRQLASEGKLAAVNFATSNISLALQIQQAIDGQQDRILARADKLQDSARSTLTTMLGMFQGIDYGDLSPALQNTLSGLATKAGIPSDLLMFGMETVKNQMIQAALKKSGSGSGKTDEEKYIEDFQKDASDMILKLDSRSVTWGAAWDSLHAKYALMDSSTIDSILGGSYDPEKGTYVGRGTYDTLQNF